MPALQDPIFRRSCSLVSASANDEGAWGIIISQLLENREVEGTPQKLKLSRSRAIQRDPSDKPVMLGGPLAGRPHHLHTLP